MGGQRLKCSEQALGPQGTGGRHTLAPNQTPNTSAMASLLADQPCTALCRHTQTATGCCDASALFTKYNGRPQARPTAVQLYAFTAQLL